MLGSSRHRLLVTTRSSEKSSRRRQRLWRSRSPPPLLAANERMLLLHPRPRVGRSRRSSLRIIGMTTIDSRIRNSTQSQFPNIPSSNGPLLARDLADGGPRWIIIIPFHSFSLLVYTYVSVLLHHCTASSLFFSSYHLPPCFHYICTLTSLIFFSYV